MSELFCDLFGQPISAATVMSLVERCAGQLVGVEQQIKTTLSQKARLLNPVN